MARPNLSHERRQQLVLAVAKTFVELGYRRTTTAALAARCGVQETVLYRLWPDKRAMFVAAIEFVAEHSKAVWARAAAQPRRPGSGAKRVLEYEATHLGEFGMYRILFAGLSESDDEVIAGAMRTAYQRLLGFITQSVQEHREQLLARGQRDLPEAAFTAWALLGLGTAINIGRELSLLSARDRQRLLDAVGQHLLG